MTGAVSASALSGASPGITMSRRAARAVDNGDGLLVGRGGLLGWGFCNRLGSVWRRGGNFLSRGRGLTQGDMRDRLAAERIVVEDGNTHKGDQKQAQQHRKRLRTGKQQPVSALPAHLVLSERRAQI